MASESAAEEKEICSRCGKTVQLHSAGIPVDEHTIVCETCYRLMMAPDSKAGVMEAFD